MEHELNIRESDILCFYNNIKYYQVENHILVISPDTANWIVIDSEKEKFMLEKLRKGINIGEIINSLSCSDKKIFIKLLSKIFSREFAGINKKIKPVEIDTSDLLCCYLTNACNLRCPHCYMDAGIRVKSELYLKDWIKVLRDFKYNGGKGVTFTGGEPLMNTDFYEIVKTAHDIGLIVTVLSNGSMFTDKLIHDLYKYIDEIQISIDGVNNDMDSIFRGGNHFYSAIHTVILFSNLGVKTSVATTLPFETISEGIDYKYNQFVTYIQNKCNNKVTFRLTKKMLPGRNVSYSRVDNERYYQSILKIEKSVDPNSDLENFIEDHNQYNLLLKNCGFGGLTISSTGNVYFCNRIHQLNSIGNVKKLPIKYFLDKGKYIKNRTSVDNIYPCKNCDMRYICGGMCRIDDSNFKGKPENCKKFEIICPPLKVETLKKKMVDSFLYYYNY